MIFRDNWASLIAELRKPSDDSETVYYFAVIALAHVMASALLASLVWPFFPAFIAFVPAYWILKEVKDIRRGGSRWDSLADTAFVAAGSLYMGPFWWPALPFLLLLLFMAFRTFSKGNT